MRAIHGKEWFWHHPIADIIAAGVDRLGLIAAVVKRRDKVRQTDIPKPLPRPWDVEKTTKKIGNRPMGLANMRGMLGW